MHRYILHNREIREAYDRCLSAGQIGFLNGWGVFSTLRVSSGVLFAFERHYRRMQRDARLMRVPFPLSPEELESALLSLIEANRASDAVLRVAVVRNSGGLFEGSNTRDFDVVAFTAELNRWGQGVHLSYVPNARFGASAFAGTKVTSWAQNLTCYEKAHEDGFDEVVLLNEHGQVSECTSANIFSIQGRQVYTPPLATSGCLPGVTRAVLLEEIQVEGVNMEERELFPSDLEASDCVFITSTTRDLLPVSTIDGRQLEQKQQVLAALRRSYLAYVDSYVATAAVSKNNLVNS